MSAYEIFMTAAGLGVIRGFIEFWPEIRASVVKKRPTQGDGTEIGTPADPIGLVGDGAPIIDGTWRYLPPILEEPVDGGDIGRRGGGK